MSDKYRANRFQPVVDYNNYAAIAAALKNDKERSRVCGPGYEEINAPTSGGPRPRALKCCYNPTTETLVIVMTDPGADGRPQYSWIQYDQVEQGLWDELKSMPSTNDFVEGALLGFPWDNTSYGELPRTRAQIFQVGFNEQP